MGAGILPTTIYKNKLYFLFGKENKYETSAHGFSDFGGGTDGSEDFLATACREASEELTGFIGSAKEIQTMLEKTGTYIIDFKSDPKRAVYRMHIFHFPYNECLPTLFNNTHKFIIDHMSQQDLRKTCIFEKEQLQWFTCEEMMQRKSEFRHYFQNIIDIIHAQRDAIRNFIRNTPCAQVRGISQQVGVNSGRRGRKSHKTPFRSRKYISKTRRRSSSAHHYGGSYI